jgi:hypothetical protein
MHALFSSRIELETAELLQALAQMRAAKNKTATNSGKNSRKLGNERGWKTNTATAKLQHSTQEQHTTSHRESRRKRYRKESHCRQYKFNATARPVNKCTLGNKEHTAVIGRILSNSNTQRNKCGGIGLLVVN